MKEVNNRPLLSLHRRSLYIQSTKLKLVKFVVVVHVTGAKCSFSLVQYVCVGFIHTEPWFHRLTCRFKTIYEYEENLFSFPAQRNFAKLANLERTQWFSGERKKPFRGSVVSDAGEKEKPRVQVTLWGIATFRNIYASCGVTTMHWWYQMVDPG